MNVCVCVCVCFCLIDKHMCTPSVQNYLCTIADVKENVFHYAVGNRNACGSLHHLCIYVFVYDAKIVRSGNEKWRERER